MIRPRPCLVCGRRVDTGESRCEAHKVGSGRPRPCLVCGKPSQGNYCAAHDPQRDEQLRNERNPYRQAYRDKEYAKHRVYAFERAHGKCQNCGIYLQPAEWECDHIVPLSRGGTNDLSNLRVVCKPCHKTKTREDRRN